MQALISSRPTCLGSSFNLGVVDFYPASSGKEGVAAHLMKRFGVPAEGSVFLCDDDNDMQLAAMVGKAFLPTISAVSDLSALGWCQQMHESPLKMGCTLLPLSRDSALAC